MRIAYLDCVAGISGDMTLGALLAVGVPLRDIEAHLRELPLDGWELREERVVKHGIAATRAVVTLAGEPTGQGRRLGEIAEIIEGSSLESCVVEQSLAVFRRIADAEARVHGISPEQVHFHELGGVDAIVDIVGSVVGFHLLGVTRIHGSAIPLSHGTVTMAHGTYPVPPPAVMELAKGLPTRPIDVEGETVTPTGAAILTTLAASLGAMPAMRIEQVGYGAGAADWPGVPNVLRLVVGESTTSEAAAEDTVYVVQANLDDMQPELYELAVDRAFAAGALDVWLTPIQMKKGRPGVQLSALTHEQELQAVTDVFFADTTTFGVRVAALRRRCLEREWTEVETEYGKVRVKLGKLEGRVTTRAPEYDDCHKLATMHGVPLKDVYLAALRALG